MSDILSQAICDVMRETLANIYETIVVDESATVTFPDLAKMVNKLKKDKDTGDLLLMEMRRKMEVYTAEIEAANTLIDLIWRKIQGEKNLYDALVDADVSYREARLARERLA